MNTAEFKIIQDGASIVLKDFHTMEALGKEYTGVVNKVHRFDGGPVAITSLEINPAPGVVLAVVAITGVREIGDPAFRMYRKWTEGNAKSVTDPAFVDKATSQFVPFQQRFDDLAKDEAPLAFSMCPGFPVSIGGSRFCAWEADPSRVDKNYWARNCLVEVMRSGFAVVWFGWDVSVEDVDLVVTGE